LGLTRQNVAIFGQRLSSLRQLYQNRAIFLKGSAIESLLSSSHQTNAETTSAPQATIHPDGKML
jgi:hypothetical protein